MDLISKFKNSMFKFGSKKTSKTKNTIKNTNTKKRNNNPDLKTGLINRGFNLDIKDLEISTIGDRNIQLIKEVENTDGDAIYMEIRLTINDWNGRKEYEWMDKDDFYISGISNRDKEGSLINRLDLNRAKGVFTNFIREFVGSNEFYVRGATPYWDKTFTVLDKIDDITICQTSETVAKGVKRKYSGNRKTRTKMRTRNKSITRNKRRTHNKRRTRNKRHK